MENPAGGNRGAPVFQKGSAGMSHKHTTTPAFRNGTACASRPTITSVEPIARSLHAFGVRPLGELLLELCGEDADRWARVERYAGMSPALVNFFRGEEFPPRPDLRVVGGQDHD
jgi:hypothetical protein